jgi:hypothetical protein
MIKEKQYSYTVWDTTVIKVSLEEFIILHCLENNL